MREKGREEEGGTEGGTSFVQVAGTKGRRRRREEATRVRRGEEEEREEKGGDGERGTTDQEGAQGVEEGVSISPHCKLKYKKLRSWHKFVLWICYAECGADIRSGNIQVEGREKGEKGEKGGRRRRRTRQEDLGSKGLAALSAYARDTLSP
eukprot:3171298-Rhodomonas_salina.1